jgi:hypothetical protein
MNDMRKYLNLLESADTYQDGAPEIGTKFEFNGGTFAVAGWMTEMREPGSFGKRGGKLVACPFDKASYVIALGGKGPGAIAPIRDIKIVGQMGWDEQQRSKVVAHAMELISKRFTINNPYSKKPGL